jgi:CubicO group peptidase (beta-lactamase class C family)
MHDVNYVLDRRTAEKPLILLAIGMVAFFAGSSWCGPASQKDWVKRPGLDPKVEAAIDEFRASVPQILDEGGVPGAAIALVDNQGILWAEGFGHLGSKSRKGVTADTPFLISGLSKLITATAVMFAVQDGLVSLDEPITTYLPEFTINSRYEEHPERKITLRRLLDYTAGLPLETSLGNYFEAAPSVSFEDHVKSVYSSWLVYGVGTGFCYGSVSFDLAGYVIQRVSGKPWEQYVKEKVFIPLGMTASAVDRTEILKNKNRAIGSMMGMAALPAVYPGLGAAGMYSTVRDYSRLLQLHINRGTLDGQRLLDESLVEAIHKPTGIVKEDPNVYYGMGIHIDKRAPERTEQLIWNDGWGFGFYNLMHWYPEYGIGGIVLTNKLPHPVLAELGLTLTDRLIKGRLVEKRSPQPEPDGRGCVNTWRGWSEHKPTPYQPSWRRYCGLHHLRFTEYNLEWWATLATLIKGRDEFTPRIRVYEKGGFLCVTESEFFIKIGMSRHVDEKLEQVKPGIFATRSGITLDFTRDAPTWRNYHIE